MILPKGATLIYLDELRPVASLTELLGGKRDVPCPCALCALKREGNGRPATSYSFCVAGYPIKHIANKGEQ